MNIADRERIYQIVGEQCNIDFNNLTSSTDLKKHLMIDSLDRIEIVMELEKEFEFKITPDEEAYQWETIEDIVKYVESMLEEVEERRYHG